MKMDKKELIKSVLDGMGYHAVEDEEGDLMLRYEMKNIYVLTGDDDEQYVILLLPQFEGIKEGEDMLTLATCNKMTRELKLVKVYIDQTFKNVSAACEFFYSDEESLKRNISRSLEILGVVRSTYRKTKMELTE